MIETRFKAMDNDVPRPNTCTEICFWVECGLAHQGVGHVLWHESSTKRIKCNGGGRRPCCGPGNSDRIECIGQDPYFDEEDSGTRKRSP